LESEGTDISGIASNAKAGAKAEANETASEVPKAESITNDVQ
jgi:hypothetical protein